MTHHLDHLNDLRLRCHRLIDAIARQPYGAKRLQACLKALELAQGYKSGRQIRAADPAREE